MRDVKAIRKLVGLSSTTTLFLCLLSCVTPAEYSDLLKSETKIAYSPKLPPIMEVTFEPDALSCRPINPNITNLVIRSKSKTIFSINPQKFPVKTILEGKHHTMLAQLIKARNGEILAQATFRRSKNARNIRLTCAPSETQMDFRIQDP